MSSCRLSTISKVRLYTFVLYEENTGDYCHVEKHLTSFPPFSSFSNFFLFLILVLLTYLHQNTATLFKPGGLFQVDKTCQKHAPNCTINNCTSKCKKLSLWGGGHPPPTPRSLRSLGLGRFAPSQVIFTAPLQLNPRYATATTACSYCNFLLKCHSSVIANLRTSLGVWFVSIKHAYPILFIISENNFFRKIREEYCVSKKGQGP